MSRKLTKAQLQVIASVETNIDECRGHVNRALARSDDSAANELRRVLTWLAIADANLAELRR